VATSTYLTNPTVNLAPTTGGAQVDLTDQCRSATITLGVDSLESTAFGDTGHRFVPGLQTVSVELEMYLSYGAGEVEATLFANLGTGTTELTISPSGTSESASNPEFVISNMQLVDYTPITGAVGELSNDDRLIHWRNLRARHHTLINQRNPT
jgi:hypothetical protein